MKILEVTHVFSSEHFAVGGTEIVYHLSKELAKKGHDVSLYTSDYKPDKARIESLQQFKVDVFNFKIWLNLAGFYITPFMLKSAVEVKHFDVIHMHNYRTFQNIVVAHYAKKYNIPYIFQAEGSLLTFFQKGVLKKVFDAVWGHRMLKDATKVVAASQMEASQYKSIGVDKDKIVIVPFGIDLTEFENLPERGKFRRKYGITDNQKIILYLGRIHKIKGLDLLLEAFTDVSRNLNNVKLVIVGPDDGYLYTMKRLIADLGISSNVLFTGPLYGQEKLKAYVDADVYVLPSFYEDFGLTVLEAIACGTPVIVTDRCGTADVVDGQAGLVVPRDKGQLSSAILNILSDERLRRRFGEGGRKLARGELGWDNVILDVEKIYLSVIER
jgi:glycosyltransferase involved in cell wall biosynthesis